MEYFILYAVSKDSFRIVNDKDTGNVVLFSTYADIESIKQELVKKHPDVHYHIRVLKLEQKIIRELGY